MAGKENPLTIVVVGSRTVGKRSLVHNFRDKPGIVEDESSLVIDIDGSNVEFRVCTLDESVDPKKRRDRMLNAHVAVLAYSTVDPESFLAASTRWIKELQQHIPNVPLLLLGTKVDRVPPELRDKVKSKAGEAAKTLSCMMGFSVTSAVKENDGPNKLITQFFERVVRSAQDMEFYKQRMYESETKKRTRLFQKKKQVSLPDVLKHGAMMKMSDVNTDYTYSWRGELILSMMEELMDTTNDYSYSDIDRDMTVELDLDVPATAASEVAKRLVLFYHFLPIATRTLENHNLSFWLETDDLKHNADLRSQNPKKPHKRMKKEALRIYRDYIAIGADKEINIESDLRQRITIDINSITHPRIFDKAQFDVIKYLSSLYQEKFLTTRVVTGDFGLLKTLRQSELLPRAQITMPDDVLVQAVGQDLPAMLRHCVHVMSLMEFLNSTAAGDKRPLAMAYSKETDPARIALQGARYLFMFVGFNAHVDREKSMENLLFWLDVEDFRSLSVAKSRWDGDVELHNIRVQSQVLARAQHIFQRYINEESLYLVNIPAQQKSAIRTTFKEIKDALETPLQAGRRDDVLNKAFHMFDNAQREILLLMKRDSWRRFGASQEARKMKDVLAKKLLNYSDEDVQDTDFLRTQEKFQQRFDLMEDEDLYASFPCALEKKMLLHGELHVSKHHISFLSNVFGFKTRLVHNFADLVEISTEVQDVRRKNAQAEDGVVIKTYDGQAFILRNIVPSKGRLLYAVRKARSRADGRGMGSRDLREEDEEDENNTKGMSEEDWEAFKEGADLVTYRGGEVVLEQGTPAGSVYQIARGTCKIIKNAKSGSPVVLRTCEEGEIIGEISFIEGGMTSASVVAETDKVVVYVMSRDFIERTLVTKPGLPGRFYKFLATLLADRLRTKKVVDGGDLDADVAPDVRFRVLFHITDESQTVVQESAAAVKDAETLMYGRLYLTNDLLCFHSRVLASEKRVVLAIADIRSFKTSGRNLSITRQDGREVEILRIQDVEGCKSKLAELRTTAQPVVLHNVMGDTAEEIDWSLFLNGAKLKHYKKNEAIVTQGQSTQFVYQIGNGMARVEFRDPDTNLIKVYREMGPGEMFGEMSFLQGGEASASIVAGTDDTWVYWIDKKFVDSLLDLNAELPGRFYKFLAGSLADRLRN